jgi:SAM-dependent methyltransferase
MESPLRQSLDHICRRLTRNELGMWCSAESSEKCHYPADGQARLVRIEDDSFWFVHRRNCIVRMVEHFHPGGLIIDAGGGNGFVTAGLKDAGFNTVLLEPDMRSAVNASQRGITQIICSTIGQAQFEPHSISAIGIFDVIEHIEDDNSFLEMIRDILEPQGKLYLTAPAFPFLWSLEDRYAQHFRRYRLGPLRRQLQRCGFAVDYSTYLFSYLFLPLLFVKTIPTKLGFSKLYTHEQTRQEHVIGPGFVKNILNQIHAWEQRRILKRKAIPWGTSVMVAAHVC